MSIDEVDSSSTRFRPGQSGNPKGRPRKQRQAEANSAFDILESRTLTATQDGVSRELTIEEALAHRTYQNAIRGSRSAERIVMKWIVEREQARAKLRPRGLNISFRIEARDPKDVDEAMVLLGIANVAEGKVRNGGGPYLQLQAWPVCQALRRRGLRTLTDEEIVWPSRFHR
jgi:hypothetical protein